MYNFKKLLLALTAVTMAVLYAGCDCDRDPVPDIVFEPYISVSASAKFSRDVLEFVSPVLTISGNNRTQTFELKPNGVHLLLGDTLSFCLSSDSIYVDVRYRKEQFVKGSVSLEFIRKDNVHMTKEEYQFSTTFLSSYVIFNGKEITKSSELGKFEVSEKLERADVEAFIVEHLFTPIKIDLDINNKQ